MYYIKSLYFYSFLGFCLESTIYKINHSPRHSGIFYGPLTMVYGFGILSLILLKKYFLDHLQTNKYLKLIITFITCWIALTLIEWIGGNTLYQIFHINMWNYSKKYFHCGKYICLELSIIWGILGTIYIYYLKTYFDKYIHLMSTQFTYIILGLNLLDTILVFLNKLP